MLLEPVDKPHVGTLGDVRRVFGRVKFSECAIELLFPTGDDPPLLHRKEV